MTEKTNSRVPSLAALALIAAAFVTSTAYASDIRDMRLWAGPESTRLVLELNGAVVHTLLTLQNPDRVVVDINDAKLAASIPDGQGIVKKVRVGPRDGGVLRVVLDLSGRAQANSFTMEPNESYGQRLVIDLKTPGSGSAAANTPVKANHAPTDNGRDLVIAIDAGHGGEDPGAIGRGGTREKDVVLAIARALKDRINREQGMRAVLIRDGDYYVGLRDRMGKARQQKADLFVSIHADSIANRDIAGSSVYILSPRGASSEAARWLAERENKADLIGGVSLDDKDNVLASVLLDLSQTASLTASMTAAEQVLRELGRVGEVRKHDIQQAGFMVLKSPDIPSMLIETAYISNPTEERRLRTGSHQEKLAGAIHGGIRAYFTNNPPPGTYFASLRSKPARVASESTSVGTN